MEYCAICGMIPVEQNGFVCKGCADKMDPFALAAAGYQVSSDVFSIDSNEQTTPAKRSLLKDKTEAPESYSTKRAILSDEATGAVEDGSTKLSAAINATLASAATQPSKTPAVASPAGAISNTGAASVVQATPISGGSSAGNAQSSSGSMSLVSGVAKNVVQDVDRRGVIWRWFKSVGTGASFSVDPDITEFQVFPDFSGTTLTATGTVSDQVVMYGKIRTGMISENNDVEVYGRRDKSNTIVASQVKNIATGAVAKPALVMSATTTRVITLLLIALIGLILFTWGPGFFIDIALLVIFILLLPLIIKVFVWLFTLIIMKA